MKILIVTTSGDSSTNNVMDWIFYLGFDPIRYNVDNDIGNYSVSHEFGIRKNKTFFRIQEKHFNTDMLSAIWFRKFTLPNLTKNLKENSNLGSIANHITSEFFSGLYAIFNSWQVKNICLGGKITKQPSKMEMLIAAKELKIDIPDTLLTNEKTKLKLFIKKHHKVITKPIREGNLFNKIEKKSFKISACMFTELLDKTSMKKIPNYFFLSLFQEALDKEIEIRTFYLNDKCYSMAIFSQLDEQTNIDFRMYNNENGNRNTPYKLPNVLESKIKKLMYTLGLKTGSLDFIKTKDGRFVFLEVNPWGQYDMVSYPCNYHLDKKIAEYLTRN